ncbi:MULTISPECIES: hypothetical protein [Xanthomonas]|uniref:hypothetical protein n=1 Tax=Xanthomonas TaxID=338 RepID=UPI0011B06D05|nr:hypothetical protein [Xanthomonas arboricola]
MHNTPGPVRQLIRRTGAFLALLGGHLSIRRSPRLYETIVEWLNEPRWSTNAMMSALAFTISVRRVARSVRLDCRTRWSRIAFTFRHRRVGADRPAAQVKSMLCPTRSRVKRVQLFVRSVHRTCADPSQVELLFYVDDDDPQLDQYRIAVEKMRAAYSAFRALELIVGPPISVSRSWNVLADKCSGNLLMMANDDQMYIDYGWDFHLDKCYGEREDEVFALFFEDGQYPPDGGDFPIVSRRWYETLGYFTPGIFEFWYNEAWIFDVANRLQRIIRISGVLVDHLHYSEYKSVLDDTYKRHRLNYERVNRDSELYNRTADDRQAAADKLRALMVS